MSTRIRILLLALAPVVFWRVAAARCALDSPSGSTDRRGEATSLSMPWRGRHALLGAGRDLVSSRAAGTTAVDRMAFFGAFRSPDRTSTPTAAPPGGPAPPQPPLASRVLIVYNSNATPSKTVADYYASRRHIPSANKFGYGFSDPSNIYYDEYGRFAAALKRYMGSTRAPGRKLLKDEILYIVFTYQTPFYVYYAPYNIADQIGTSVDSFTADLWGEAPNWLGSVKVNPYHATTHSPHRIVVEPNPPVPFQPFADFRDRGDNRVTGYPKNGPSPRVYSVWRLDAPTAAQAQAQVDNALYAEANGLQGIFYFKTIGRTGDAYKPGLPWYEMADMVYNAARIAQASPKIGPSRVVMDQGWEAPGPNAACFLTWGDGYKDVFTWNKGAFGVSCRSGPLAGGPRAGLAAALADDAQKWSVGAIDRGITMTTGNLDEPYSHGIPAFDVGFRALVGGATMGDAWARSYYLLTWKNLMIGDPLYTPFQ